VLAETATAAPGCRFPWAFERGLQRRHQCLRNAAVACWAGRASIWRQEAPGRRQRRCESVASEAPAPRWRSNQTRRSSGGERQQHPGRREWEMLNWGENLSGQLGVCRRGNHRSAEQRGGVPGRDQATQHQGAVPPRPSRLRSPVVVAAQGARSGACSPPRAGTAATPLGNQAVQRRSLSQNRAWGLRRRRSAGQGFDGGGPAHGLERFRSQADGRANQNTVASAAERIPFSPNPQRMLFSICGGKKALAPASPTNRCDRLGPFAQQLAAGRLTKLAVTYLARLRRAVSRPRLRELTAPLEPSLVLRSMSKNPEQIEACSAKFERQWRPLRRC